jgi:hypothetical protein
VKKSVKLKFIITEGTHATTLAIWSIVWESRVQKPNYKESGIRSKCHTTNNIELMNPSKMCLQFSKYDTSQSYFLEKIKLDQIWGKHATMSTEFSKIYGGEKGGTCQTDGQTHRHNFHWNTWKERTAWNMYNSFEKTLKQMDLEGREGTAHTICSSCK